jgi:hypothetical protein
MAFRTILILAAALIAVAPASSQTKMPPKDLTLEGGPWDGIVVGPLVRARDGKAGFGLKPSLANAAPAPAALAPQVEALIRAYRVGDRAHFKAILAPDATAELCRKGMFGDCRSTSLLFEEQFAEHCAANTPYFLKENGQIRLEWLYKGQLYYISYLNFRGGKVTHIKTIIADVPPILNSEASKSNG